MIAFIVAVGFSIFQWFTKKSEERSDREKALKKITSKKKSSTPSEGHEKLAGHTGQFNKKEIVTVRGNIHCAIGYGLANCILIEGKRTFLILSIFFIDNLSISFASGPIMSIFLAQP